MHAIDHSRIAGRLVGLAGLIKIVLIGLTIAMIGLHGAPARASAVVSGITDCKQLGGTKKCVNPGNTPWRFEWGWVPVKYLDPNLDTWVTHLGVAPWCLRTDLPTYLSTNIVGQSIEEAVGRGASMISSHNALCINVPMTTATPAVACAGTSRNEYMRPFNSYNPNPMQGKNVIQKKDCYVTVTTQAVSRESLIEPGMYIPISAGTGGGAPWRELICPMGEPRNKPDGTGVLCVTDKVFDPECDSLDGNPINTATGNKQQTEVDYNAPRLKFVRYFNSDGQGTGQFGRGWRSSYDAYLDISFDADNVTRRVLMSSPIGRNVMFKVASDGTITQDAYVNSRLARVLNAAGAEIGWHYLNKEDGQIETYDLGGKLQSIASKDGYVVTLSYDASGRLNLISDRFGRTLTLEYEVEANAYAGNPLSVKRMIDAAGQVYEYVYDQPGAMGNLVEVRYPDQKSRNYTYMDDPTGRGFALLTGIIDERGIQYGTWAYDLEGRATLSMHANGDDRIDVVYGLFEGTQIPGAAISDGTSSRSKAFVEIDSKMFFTGRSQPAGSGCAATSRSVVRDLAGNKVEETDFNGTRTCRMFLTGRNVPSVELFGDRSPSTVSCTNLVASNASGDTYKVTSGWHPLWDVKTLEAGPKKLSYTGFNGLQALDSADTLSCAPSSAVLPDGSKIAVPCVTRESATDDERGNAGLFPQYVLQSYNTQYTYNADGQVLTSTDSRGKVSLFEYYDQTSADATRGDLKKVSTPTGLTTRFVRYNLHGQPLEVVAPNGLSTTYTYDVRLRKTSEIVGSRETRFTYDGVGNLVSLQAADGTVMTYVYSGSNRLQKVIKPSGDYTEYSYDTRGNLTQEEVKDSAGTVVQSTQRTYDALNRVQQSVGASR